MNPEEKIQKAKDITQSRILTQEEFKQIRMRQLAKEVDTDPKVAGKGKNQAKRARKRKIEDTLNIDSDDETNRYGITILHLFICLKLYY